MYSVALKFITLIPKAEPELQCHPLLWLASLGMSMTKRTKTSLKPCCQEVVHGVGQPEERCGRWGVTVICVMDPMVASSIDLQWMVGQCTRTSSRKQNTRCLCPLLLQDLVTNSSCAKSQLAMSWWPLLAHNSSTISGPLSHLSKSRMLHSLADLSLGF